MSRGIISKIDNLKILKNVETMNFGGNTLSELDITGLTKLTYLWVSDNLSETSGNNILINLDEYGLLNGYVQISSVPSGEGLTAKENLIDKGWSVTTG